MTEPRKIEDNPKVFETAQRLVMHVLKSGLSPQEGIDAMFSALTATAVVHGWSFENYRDWFIRSAEVSYTQFAAIQDREGGAPV